MATAPQSRRLNLTRDQLATFLTDQQQIRQFELLFSTVDELQVIIGTDFEYQADTAAATANEALAQLSALAQDTAVDDAVLNAKVQQALDAIPGLAQALELLALAPRQELGTIASQNSDNVNITGGLISGLDAPLPVASGGIGVTTSAANQVFAGPTSGATAPPGFRSLVVADIPALTSGTSILYGSGTGGFSNVTIGSGVSFAAGILSATGSGGTVTSVTGTSPVVSSGGTTPAISLSSGYGDTQNPYASKTANYVLAAPNGSSGAPTFRALVASDIPALPYGTGTVTSVSVVSANGFAGTVATATTTPAITMSTSISGLLYGNGTALAATTVSAPLAYSAGTLSITQSGAASNGYLSSTDWNTFNNKGSGTVTSVAAITLGTTGTDLSSTVANGTTTPVITLNVPTASASNRGALSSTDWSTFNNKEPAIAAGTTAQYWRGDKTWQDFATAVRATVLTGLSTATNAIITAADTVLSALGKLQAQITANLSTLTSHTSATGTAVHGLGTMSTQNANSVTITGGSINGTTVGASTASTGKFTSLAYNELVGSGYGLNIKESGTFNDNLTHAFSSWGAASGIAYINSGNGPTIIPWFSNGGGGVGFLFSILDPDAGTWTYGNTVTFTSIGSTPNTYSFTVSNGAGQPIIQRTGGTTSYSIYIAILGR